MASCLLCNCSLDAVVAWRLYLVPARIGLGSTEAVVSGSLKYLVMRTKEMQKKGAAINTLSGLLQFYLFNRPHHLGKKCVIL